MSLRIKFSITVLSLLLLLTGSYFLYMEEQGNFHSVVAGEAYRSAHLDRDVLVPYIETYNIRSILNLRGTNADKPWYKEEINICATLEPLASSFIFSLDIW